MGTKTGIEWTDATWNPIRGCTPVSAGCKNCYAAKVAKRFSFPGGPYEGLVRTNVAGERTDDWNGNIRFVEKHLLDPLKWREPRRIFVNSMSDLFHEGVTRKMLLDIAGVMVLGYWNTYQILTKRPENLKIWEEVVAEAIEIMRAIGERGGIADPKVFRALDMRRRDKVPWSSVLPNVWLGVSVENQAAADKRIPLLLQTPAAVRFISAEPLLGPVDLKRIDQGQNCWIDALNAKWTSYHPIGGALNRTSRFGKLDWLICGGESGPGARPMHPDWARSLRDQCTSAGVPFFFKQWGQWVPTTDPKVAAERGIPFEDCMSYIPRKHDAGSLLDGCEWKQFPKVQP